MEPILYVADRTYFECIVITALLLRKIKKSAKKRRELKHIQYMFKSDTKPSNINTITVE